MSFDHDTYRRGYGNAWGPWWAEGYISTGGTATTLGGNYAQPMRQPVGFRGAAPGASLDERGLPRVRVKVGSRK